MGFLFKRCLRQIVTRSTNWMELIYELLEIYFGNMLVILRNELYNFFYLQINYMNFIKRFA